MKNSAVESGLRWTLAASMLLMMPLSSTTFVHQHSGGGAAHHHKLTDHSSLPPTSPLPFDDDGDRNGVGMSAVDVHHHGCLLFLGMVTYQSGPGNPSDSHRQAPRGLETAFVLSPSGVQTFSKSLAADHLQLAASTAVSTGCVGESMRPVLSPGAFAPASLLCDRARHERSGVQLT
jgi:hypothetical protein